MKEKNEENIILKGKIVVDKKFDNRSPFDFIRETIGNKEKLKIPFLYQGQEIGFSILDFKNNTINSTITNHKFIEEINKEQSKIMSMGFKEDD